MGFYERINYANRLRTLYRRTLLLEARGVELKQQMIRAIQELPEDASVQDGIERLYLIHKVGRGIQQADSGESVSQEEARQRMAQWLK